MKQNLHAFPILGKHIRDTHFNPLVINNALCIKADTVLSLLLKIQDKTVLSEFGQFSRNNLRMKLKENAGLKLDPSLILNFNQRLLLVNPILAN